MSSLLGVARRRGARRSSRRRSANSSESSCAGGLEVGEALSAHDARPRCAWPASTSSAAGEQRHPADLLEVHAHRVGRAAACCGGRAGRGGRVPARGRRHARLAAASSGSSRSATRRGRRAGRARSAATSLVELVVLHLGDGLRLDDHGGDGGGRQLDLEGLEDHFGDGIEGAGLGGLHGVGQGLHARPGRGRRGRARPGRAAASSRASATSVGDAGAVHLVSMVCSVAIPALVTSGSGEGRLPRSRLPPGTEVQALRHALSSAHVDEPGYQLSAGWIRRSGSSRSSSSRSLSQPIVAA